MRSYPLPLYLSDSYLLLKILEIILVKGDYVFR